MKNPNALSFTDGFPPLSNGMTPKLQNYCARRWGDNMALTVITDTASGAVRSTLPRESV